MFLGFGAGFIDREIGFAWNPPVKVLVEYGLVVRMLYFVLFGVARPALPKRRNRSRPGAALSRVGEVRYRNRRSYSPATFSGLDISSLPVTASTRVPRRRSSSLPISPFI